MRSLVAGVLLAIALTTVAKAAEILAGGGLYTVGDASSVTCTLFNAGSSNVSISSIAIYDHAGNAIAPAYNSCSSSLTAHKSCLFQTTGAVPFATYSCRAIVGNKTNIRGVLAVRDYYGSKILDSIDLR